MKRHLLSPIQDRTLCGSSDKRLKTKDPELATCDRCKKTWEANQEWYRTLVK